MFEKLVNSKVYHVIDQIVRVVWLNIIMFVTIALGLVFFSFGPAILAGTYVVKMIYQKYDGPILPVFIRAFKKFYKKGTIIFLIYVVALIILTFNLFFFLTQIEETFSWFYFASFIITFFISLLTFMALIHSLLLSTTYPKSSIKILIKSGYKLAMVFIVRGLIFTLILMLLVALTLIMPIAILLVSFLAIVATIEFVIFKQYDKIPMFDNDSDKIIDEIMF